MEYFEREKKSELEQKVLKNQVCVVVFISFYFIGIIALIFFVPKSIKLNFFNVTTAAIAPICATGWFYFAKVLHNLKASVYNRFGSGDLYRQLFLFWGNRKLAIVALIFALLMTSLSFSNLLDQREFNKLRRELVELQNKVAKTRKNLRIIRNSIDEVEKQTTEELKNEKQPSEELKKEALKRQETLQKAISEIDSLRKELVKPLDISPKKP